MEKKKIIRITTVPISLEKLLTGQLSFMNNFYQVIAVSSEKNRLENFGKENELEVFHLEMTRKITPFQDLLAIIKLFKFLKKEKPFIVHTHTPKAGMVGMIASKLAGIPNRLHTVAGLPLLEKKGVLRRILDLVEKVTYACATKVYPNSFGLYDIILKNQYTKKNKLKVIGNGSSNGIDTSYFDTSNYSSSESFQLKKQLGITENEFVFIFVGRLVKDKGINELISAFEELSKENNNVKLVLVGPFEDDLDPLEIKTKEIIKKSNAIIATGFQQDVRPYFAISNVLVFPSYREGFPNVVIQAGAMELPSIVSDINGCNEIIIENINGVIIPVKSENAIFESMKKLMENKSFYNHLQHNARNSIKEKYEQKVVWEAILKEYQNLNS